MPGFDDVVAVAWEPSVINADPFRVLDLKLRNVAKALRRWSNTKIGSVRLQLAMAREVIRDLIRSRSLELCYPGRLSFENPSNYGSWAWRPWRA